MKTSEHLTLGAIYSRETLREQFGITDATLDNGIFLPKGHESVWIFVTEVKTADRTQYTDQLDGDDLFMDGQMKGRTDRLLIDHARDGRELLAFHRRHKSEHLHEGFRYVGRFTYVSHEGGGPARFHLRRVGSRPEPTPPAFLLTWNPENWHWETLEEDVEAVRTGRAPADDEWRCGNSQVRKGDRLFWLRQGVEPRGIFATGWATSNWDNGIRFEFETLLHPVHDQGALIPRDTLVGGALNEVHWNTQRSGISINSAAATVLEQMWAERVGQEQETPSAGEDGPGAALEGAVRYTYVRHRRRERRLREDKIARALSSGVGLRCEVPGCGFHFSEVYGALGERYAQVHHLHPLSSRESPSETRLDDLAIVCANCHVMIHIGGQCRPLDELVQRRPQGDTETQRGMPAQVEDGG
ncbi:HNH endonuclease [Stigmatella hybrida]|uniref:HNH endonuclease n=1 Tax=Stigmatella hybrida TaxID=394097 RepID=UPI001CDA815D|nr:HNH endonuclease [Stigmatella hybrida]